MQTVFTHQLAMSFIAQVKQDGAGQVELIFPVLQRITLATTQFIGELNQITDVLRGVNLLKTPPKLDLKNKKHNYHINPLIPAIESSGIHLRNALSIILNSSDVSETELGNVVQILQVCKLPFKV